MNPYDQDDREQIGANPALEQAPAEELMEKFMEEQAPLENAAEEPPKKVFRDKRAERAQRRAGPTPRRVGILTMGLSLVVIGVAILTYMISPTLDLSWVGWFAPVILILLGLEIIVRYLLGKGENFKYDLFSGFICVFLVLICLTISAGRQWIPYISPARYAAQEQMRRQFEDDVYAALREEAGISNVYTSMSVEPAIFMGRDSDKGEYYPSYTRISVSYQSEFVSEQEFAEKCYRLMTKLKAANIQTLDYLEFYGEGPNCRFSLSIRGKYQQNMDALGLEKETQVTKYEPDPADGWLPGGYDQMVEEYGQEAADRYLAEAVRRQNERLGLGDGPGEEIPEPPQEQAEPESSGAAG